MRTFVLVLRLLAQESSATRRTLKAQLSLVYPFMDAQVRSLGERLITHLAAERFLPGVDFLVNLQRLLARELLTADLTLPRSVVVVRALVNQLVAGLGEGLAADITHVGFLPRVCAHVTNKCGFLSESTLAHRAFKRSLPGVCSQMYG